MTVSLTEIIQAVLTLIAGIITAFVVPWVKTKTSVQQQSLLYATIKSLVYGAEQIYKSGNGSVKMDYVKNELAKQGFTIDVTAIEAAVHSMNLDKMWGYGTETAAEMEPLTEE